MDTFHFYFISKMCGIHYKLLLTKAQINTKPKLYEVNYHSRLLCTNDSVKNRHKDSLQVSVAL